MADTSTVAEKRRYEIMFIVAGDKTDDIVRDATSAVKEEITSRGGAVAHEDAWGLRNFSYPLKRQETGYYTVMHFDLPTNKVSDLTKHLRLNTNVLRFLITNVPPNYKFLTLPELRERGKQLKKGTAPTSRGAREADSIKAESASLRRPARPVAPKPDTVPAPAVPAAAAPAAEPAAEKSFARPKADKPKAAPQKPVSEESRLQELDEQIKKLINDDTI